MLLRIAFFTRSWISLGLGSELGFGCGTYSQISFPDGVSLPVKLSSGASSAYKKNMNYSQYLSFYAMARYYFSLGSTWKFLEELMLGDCTESRAEDLDEW